MYKKIFSVLVFLMIVSLGFVLAAQGDGVGDGSDEASENSGMGIDERDFLQNQEQIKTKVQDGTHMSEEGKMLKIQTQSNNRVRIEANGVNADCDCEMIQEKIQNKTKLSVKMSNGKNSEIKVMPDSASEKALERLRLKVCSQENECEMQLKEVGEGQETKMAYELKTQRKARFLGILPTKMQVKAQIHAENGEVLDVDKPWWAFLASEPAQE